MATSLKNLSHFSSETPSAKSMSFGIVVSEWNYDVTSKLLEGAIDTLVKAGCEAENIFVKWVPGSFELPLAAQYFVELTPVDAVIALGCVIRGETSHYDFVCSGVTQGVMRLMQDSTLPVGFGLLTTENLEQAMDRAGGKHGNKGNETAYTVIKMVALSRDMEQNNLTIANLIPTIS